MYAHSKTASPCSAVFTVESDGVQAGLSRHYQSSRPSAFLGDFVYPGEVNTSPSRTSGPSSPSPRARLNQQSPAHFDIRSHPASPGDPEMSSARSTAPAQAKGDTKQGVQPYKLNEEVIKEYREAFRIFDRNGDGCITCQELGTVMRSLGHQPSETEVQNMIHEVDVDGSGTIELDEFVQMMARRLNEKGDEDGEDELKEAFEVFDRNKDGFITAEELRTVMRSLGENLTDQELNEMMKAADANGDGIINFKEFQEVWLEASQIVSK